MIAPHSLIARLYRRFIARRASRPLVKGQDGSQWRDVYHGVLVATWPEFFLGVAVYFALLNLVFAVVYSTIPHGFAGARSLWDFYLFSIQTVTSASYTRIAPHSVAAEALMTCEAFLGILNVALIAGIAFARFSRPYARIVFSNVAIVTPFDGVPTLMFRAANQRANLIFDATVTVSFARQVTTREGHTMRRFEELSLVRNRTPLFTLSWTIMHRIDQSSPLDGIDDRALRDMEAEIIVMLSGTDETLADVVYARHSYAPKEILRKRRFVDVISVTSSGRRLVDLSRFHDTEPFEVADVDVSDLKASSEIMNP